MVSFTRCHPCLQGEHREPSEAHTWADDDDIQHALTRGLPDPRQSPCGCFCAREDA